MSIKKNSSSDIWQKEAVAGNEFLRTAV